VDGTPLAGTFAGVRQAQEAALERRLATATAAVRELPTRKQGRSRCFITELMRAAAALVTREGVKACWSTRRERC